MSFKVSSTFNIGMITIILRVLFALQIMRRVGTVVKIPGLLKGNCTPAGLERT